MSSTNKNVLDKFDIERAVNQVRPIRKHSKIWKYLKIFIKIIVTLAVVITFTLFIIIPIAFMASIEFQRLAVFTNMFLLNKQSDFDKFVEPGVKNFYITIVTDSSEQINLGTFHIMPKMLVEEAETNFDYDAALKHSNYSVIIYFHGSGEDRSDSLNKYKMLSSYFHVIAFDYRDFGDSSPAILSEDTIVSDSIQIYKWVRKKTTSSIYFWGHSMGSALATSTASRLKDEGIVIKGLVLESPFTNMMEAIPNHPYGKIFYWLPWYKITIENPLKKNGFIFPTDKHILNVDSPIMILHAKDDSIIPYTLGKKLSDIAKAKGSRNVIYHEFPSVHRYDHFYLYKDKDLPNYIDKHQAMKSSIPVKNSQAFNPNQEKKFIKCS